MVNSFDKVQSSRSGGGERKPERTTVFVDIETAGIETHRPIIQIAAIAVDQQLNEIEEFEVKIRFDERKANLDSLRKVHYRRAEWKRTAINPKKAAWTFARFLRRHASVNVYRQDLSMFPVAQLVCHNSEFDGPFLREWFDRLGVFMPASYRFFCTLQRAYWLFHENPQLPAPDDFRLMTLCMYFGVPLNRHDAHEATADVRATVGLYRAMLDFPFRAAIDGIAANSTSMPGTPLRNAGV